MVAAIDILTTAADPRPIGQPHAEPPFPFPGLCPARAPDRRGGLEASGHDGTWAAFQRPEDRHNRRKSTFQGPVRKNKHGNWRTSRSTSAAAYGSGRTRILKSFGESLCRSSSAARTATRRADIKRGVPARGEGLARIARVGCELRRAASCSRAPRCAGVRGTWTPVLTPALSSFPSGCLSMSRGRFVSLPARHRAPGMTRGPRRSAPVLQGPRGRPRRVGRPVCDADHRRSAVFRSVCESKSLGKKSRTKYGKLTLKESDDIERQVHHQPDVP